jgi:hypothetical protein
MKNHSEETGKGIEVPGPSIQEKIWDFFEKHGLLVLLLICIALSIYSISGANKDVIELKAELQAQANTVVEQPVKTAADFHALEIVHVKIGDGLVFKEGGVCVDGKLLLEATPGLYVVDRDEEGRPIHCESTLQVLPN